MLGVPKHSRQCFGVVAHQCLFVFWVQRGKFGDDFRVVDDHGQNSFLSGKTRFETAALTVNMGSLTTWLRRNFITTLQSR